MEDEKTKAFLQLQRLRKKLSSVAEEDYVIVKDE